MTVKRSEYSLWSEAYLEDVGEEITVGYMDFQEFAQETEFMGG